MYYINNTKRKIYLADIKTGEVIKVNANPNNILDKIIEDKTDDVLHVDDFIKYNKKGVNISDWFYTTKDVYKRFIKGIKTKFTQEFTAIDSNTGKKEQRLMLINCYGLYNTTNRRTRRYYEHN